MMHKMPMRSPTLESMLDSQEILKDAVTQKSKRIDRLSQSVSQMSKTRILSFTRSRNGDEKDFDTGQSSFY